MKKISILLSVLILFSIMSINAQSKPPIQDGSAYDDFLKENIGNEINVTIAYIDISITGTLVKIYNDGIILQSMFNEIYIPKSSIAFIKRKMQEESKK